MDKILNYNQKNKFNIHPEKTINPLSIEVNEESEHYRYYNSYNSPDYLSIRNNICKLIKKSYSVIPNKNYIFDMKKKSFVGFSDKREEYRVKNKLAGYRAFLIDSSRTISDVKYNKRVESKIEQIEHLIRKYCKE